MPVNLSVYRLALSPRGRHGSGTAYNNERLEFLGDSILGAVAAEYLFRKFPFKDEGYLTRVRSRVVSRATLNEAARKMGIDRLQPIKTRDRQSKSLRGDMLEALIGAIFIDLGFQAAKSFVLNRLFSHYLDIEQLISEDNDYKSRLLEWAVREKKQVEFRLESEVRNKGVNIYRVALLLNNNLMHHASGNSKKEAEQLVSEKCCKTLNIPDREE